MNIYFDNAATTRVAKEAADAVYNAMVCGYGNPSSLHRMGKSAEDLLEESRKTISSTVYGTPDEIYFTSGGTESDNMAIIGFTPTKFLKLLAEDSAISASSSAVGS